MIYKKDDLQLSTRRQVLNAIYREFKKSGPLKSPDFEKFIEEHGWNEFTPEPPGESTPEQIQQKLEFSVQRHLNEVAHSHRNYDSVDSAAKYIGGKNALWSAEGEALRDWAIDVWEYCYGVMGEVQSGARGIPTADELISELPSIQWPEVIN